MVPHLLPGHAPNVARRQGIPEGQIKRELSHPIPAPGGVGHAGSTTRGWAEAGSPTRMRTRPARASSRRSPQTSARQPVSRRGGRLALRPARCQWIRRRRSAAPPTRVGATSRSMQIDSSSASRVRASMRAWVGPFAAVRRRRGSSSGGRFAGDVQGVEQAGAVAMGQALHAADAAQVVEVAGGGLGGGDEEVVAQDAATGQVSVLGQPLAPVEELADGGEVARAELLRPADAPPAVLGELVDELVVAVGELVVEPGEALAGVELRVQDIAQGQQVVDVGGGVGQLAVAEGAADPVAAGLPLLGAAAQDGADEAVVGEGVAMAEQAGGDLHIEDAVGQRAGLEPAEARLLVAGVHHDLDIGVGDELPEGVEVRQGEGVEDGDAAGRGDLGEGEFGAVGVLADELGVEGEDARLADLVVEGAGHGRVGDEAGVGGWVGGWGAVGVGAAASGHGVGG